MTEQTLSDEKLLEYMEEEKIKDILVLFSSGRFLDIINKYFMTEEKPPEVPEAQKAPAPNIMFANLNPVNMAPKPIPKLILNLDLLEKCKNDRLTLQILLTIFIFCLFKTKKYDIAKTIFENYVFYIDNLIFPLILLKAKYFILCKDTTKAIDIYSEAINKFKNYISSEENKNDNNNIITIETYHQKFVYFKNIFNYLFALNNIDSKIKKLYFELKLCLSNTKFYSQAYQLILELYQKYPKDIQIIFELAKDSVIFSKIDKYQEMMEVMKKKKEEESDQKKKEIYNKFILYGEALFQVAEGKMDLAQNTYMEILKIEPGNPLVINNIALLNIYKNNPKECYKQLVELYMKGNDSANECIKNTINLIAEKFNYQKIQ
jgi:tetratricopeptide (TPR) repeat protein